MVYCQRCMSEHRPSNTLARLGLAVVTLTGSTFGIDRLAHAQDEEDTRLDPPILSVLPLATLTPEVVPTPALDSLPDRMTPESIRATEIGVLIIYDPIDQQLTPEAAPRYYFDESTQDWLEVTPGRNKYESLLPFGNRDTLLERGRVVDFNTDLGFYQDAEGQIFLPRQGIDDESDLEHGWVKITELVTSEDYVPGESGTEWILTISESHEDNGIQGIRFAPEYSEVIDDILAAFIEQYPIIRGRRIIFNLSSLNQAPATLHRKNGLQTWSIGKYSVGNILFTGDGANTLMLFATVTPGEMDPTNAPDFGTYTVLLLGTGVGYLENGNQVAIAQQEKIKELHAQIASEVIERGEGELLTAIFANNDHYRSG